MGDAGSNWSPCKITWVLGLEIIDGSNGWWCINALMDWWFASISISCSNYGCIYSTIRLPVPVLLLLLLPPLLSTGIIDCPDQHVFVYGSMDVSLAILHCILRRVQTSMLCVLCKTTWWTRTWRNLEPLISQPLHKLSIQATIYSSRYVLCRYFRANQTGSAQICYLDTSSRSLTCTT